MILPYAERLVCLALASFFLIYLATAATLALCVPQALRAAERISPISAARFLFTLRILPAALAAFGALALCVPSYLWFEPEGIEEQVGFACLFLSLLGALVFAHAIFRVSRNAVKSLLFTRRCVASGGNRNTPLVIESAQPLVVVTGLFRPRVVISKGIVNTLSPEELRVVLSHEDAHRASRDNLKRLCFSFSPGFPDLERAWLRYAEFSADDRAVAGDARQSVALASALVRVARFGQTLRPSPIAISFLGDVGDLSARVDRLLNSSQRQASHFSFGAPLMLAAGVATIVLNPYSFRLIQSALERLLSLVVLNPLR